MFINVWLDKLLSSLSHFRLVNESRLGLVAGEVYLKRLFNLARFDFVFDIGANAGQYGQVLRKHVGYRGHIFSVEPLPDVGVGLERLARADGNWSVMRSALDIKKGIAELNIMAGSEFSSLLPPSKEFEGKFDGQHSVLRQESVPAETLSDIFKEQQQIHRFKRPLLKLDTQGSELRIIEGGRDVLAKIPAIQTEVAFQSIYDGGATFLETVRLMRRLGYELSGLFANNFGHFPKLLEMDAVFVRPEISEGQT